MELNVVFLENWESLKLSRLDGSLFLAGVSIPESFTFRSFSFTDSKSSQRLPDLLLFAAAAGP